MPTIIQTFVRRTTELKMSMRAFNSLYNLSVHGDATNLSTAQKNTAKSWIVSPSSSMLASVGTTTFTQCRITESTTKLNTLGGGMPPWVTPWYHWKGEPKYSSDIATIRNQSQYVRKRQRIRGHTSYPARMSRHRVWSRA